ncbi:MAG: DNA alkylation repair protein [Pseudomonadota bacterium]
MAAFVDEVIAQLRRLRSKNPDDVSNVRLVPVEQVLGVSTGDLRELAKKIGPDADRAATLWREPYLETKALAILLLPVKAAEPDLIASWVTEIQDWSTCDLFAKSIMAPRADAIDWALKWTTSTDLYTRRAGLAVIANYCMRAVKFDADASATILSIIANVAGDERDHVRQASCWALREFGKSNTESHEQACLLALDLIEMGDSTKAWVGRCAYRELETLIKVPERRRLISRTSKTAQKYTN